MKISFNIVSNDIKEHNHEARDHLFDAFDELSKVNSEFTNLNIKNLDFKLVLSYPRWKFKDDILNLTERLNQNQKTLLWDFLNFKIYPNDKGDMVMSGYPSLPENLDSCDIELKKLYSAIRPFIEKFSYQNKLLCNEFLSENLVSTLNIVFSSIPELYTFVGKEQHKTHDYTVDVHTFGVLQECIKHPRFKVLNNDEKYTLILTALLHDITKEEYSIDKRHPVDSSNDAFDILSRFDLEKTQLDNICFLIKNHDMLEQCNKGDFDVASGKRLPITREQQDIKIKKYALEFCNNNLVELALILTEADLLSVTRDGCFYCKYSKDLEVVSKKLRAELKENDRRLS